ncbi:MAG: ATP-binding cassette domain-containing protein, partial [Thermoplasmata archaeon]|nr:ATP-binding cassette domain-containing protein [Thermoplasmata archaeon]
MENALSMRKVCFTYRGNAAKSLDGVDLDVRKGEFVTLLGANGSGKSTICLLANGLIPHAVPGTLEGIVEVFGEGTTAKSVAEISTRVGIVFQEPESQLFCMSVEEEVAFGPENLAVPREELMDRVRWALSLVGLEGYNSRAPSTLSGGEKQRVAIAAALSMRPDMLVLDEPAYALDPVGRLELFAVLRDLKDKHGMTVLLAERDAEEAAAFSDKLALVKGGRIVAQGPPRRLVCDPDAFRAAGLEPTQLGEVSSQLNKRMGGSEFSFLT